MVISVGVGKKVRGIYRKALDLALRRLRAIVAAELNCPNDYKGKATKNDVAMVVNYDVVLDPEELSVIIQIIAPGIPKRVTDKEDIMARIVKGFSREIPDDMRVHYLLILTEGAFISASAES